MMSFIAIIEHPPTKAKLLTHVQSTWFSTFEIKPKEFNCFTLPSSVENGIKRLMHHILLNYYAMTILQKQFEHESRDTNHWHN